MGNSAGTKEISNMSSIAAMSTTTTLTKHVQMFNQHEHLTYQLIINLRQQFYKHKLDDKTLHKIKELGLKRNLEIIRGGRKRTRTWYSTRDSST